MQKVKMSRKEVAVSAGIGALIVGSSAHAEMTSLIDFSTLATDLAVLIGAAITVAAGIGATVMAAKLCWNFFRRFLKG